MIWNSVKKLENFTILIINMKTETVLRGSLAMSLLTLIIVSFYFTKQTNEFADYKVKQDSLSTIQSNMIDSLRDEIFIRAVEIGRHELTRDEIFYRHPKVGKEYEQYYQHETE